jgi:hypothetical protein
MVIDSLAMNTHRFTVALSFPGEYRDYVSKVALILADKLGKLRVLYDKFHEAEFARPNLDIHLPELYRTQSDLIVIFLCSEYAKKRWCNLEWRFIRQLISTADEDRIMFLSFDEIGAIPEIGILSGDGYAFIGDRPPEEIAALILQRLGPLAIELSGQSAASAVQADISRIIKYAPAELIGREDETKLLNDAWAKVQNQQNKRPHILTFVALGGEGKTSLVAKWAADLAHQGWPGCDAAFAWSFYHQGTDEKTADSSDLFLKEGITFFGDEVDREFAASNAGAFEKGQRLARIVGNGRNILILDGVEPLQYAPTSPTPGELKDKGLAALLKGLATGSEGLCVVTTRYSIPDLKAFWQTSVLEKKLLRLSREAGVHLLKTLGVRGVATEFETLVEDVKGHALTLNMLGTYLRDAHGGDIRKRDLVKLEEADAEEQAGHAFRVIDAYVMSFESEGRNGHRALEILRLLGLFDRPAAADCIRDLFKAPRIANLTETLVGTSEAQRNLVFSRLESARLLTVNRRASGNLISLDAHPLLREYFAKEIRTQHPGSWRSAHKRIYKHLISTTHESDQPTLEDLQPLYQAVAHGCHAGLQQEVSRKVYFGRILRKEENYSTFKLGALGSDLGAIACFFEQPWNRLSLTLEEDWQAWLLNEAGFSLRALGRLTEALEPTRASVEMGVKQRDWNNAARYAVNLSELELVLGQVAGAVGDAEQCVTYADRSRDAFMRQEARGTHADALHQAGRQSEANRIYLETEQMQRKRQPDYFLLYSMQGVKYCDLLLATPERAAWQLMQNPEASSQTPELIQQCHAVSQRAAQTLQWEEGMRDAPLHDFALHFITLGRAALYELVLAVGSLSFKTPSSELKTSIDAAVDGFRRAGTTHWIPLALLTRAWLRFLTGTSTGPESAQEDLDEAWEIAERGPMRLFMADIHLYRARLFGGMKDVGGGMKYPWNKNPDGSDRGPRDDLAAARKLIEQCGYWRRKEELEDAEEAAKNW